MLIKYFYPNKNDKIEFTKQELEKLINDIYEEGRMEGIRVLTGGPIATTSSCPPIIYNEKPVDSNPYYPFGVYNEKPFDLIPYIYCTGTNSIGNTVIKMSDHIIGECQGDK